MLAHHSKECPILGLGWKPLPCSYLEYFGLVSNFQSTIAQSLIILLEIQHWVPGMREFFSQLFRIWHSYRYAEILWAARNATA